MNQRATIRDRKMDINCSIQNPGAEEIARSIQSLTEVFRNDGSTKVDAPVAIYDIDELNKDNINS
jgi:hypothetical protein